MLKREMPQPEERKPASLAIRVAVFLRQGVPCARCGERLDPDAFHMDHIQPLDALGSNAVDNWQALCLPCHTEKTRIDNARAKKGARLRFETGQQKRLREEGPVLTSRNDLRGRPSPPLRSGSFDKRLTRGVNGRVRPRT